MNRTTNTEKQTNSCFLLVLLDGGGVEENNRQCIACLFCCPTRTQPNATKKKKTKSFYNARGKYANCVNKCQFRCIILNGTGFHNANDVCNSHLCSNALRLLVRQQLFTNNVVNNCVTLLRVVSDKNS